MDFFKFNDKDFFKGVYLLLVLLFIDFGFICAFIFAWEESGNVNFISFVIVINVAFIGLNWGTIRLIQRIYKDMKIKGGKGVFNLISHYKNKSKPRGILRIIRIFIGATIIFWALWAEGSVIFKTILILLGIYNLWRVI